MVGFIPLPPRCQPRLCSVVPLLMLLMLCAVSDSASAGYETIFELTSSRLATGTRLSAGLNGRFLWGWTFWTDAYIPNGLYRGASERLASFDMLNGCDIATIAPDGHVFVLARGTVRHFVGDNLAGGSQTAATWQDLGTGGDWPKEAGVYGFAMVATSAPDLSVYVTFMYLNSSVAVVRYRMFNDNRNSSWTFVSLAGATTLPSSALQPPSLQTAKNGDVFLLITDNSCSQRNASVLHLLNGTDTWSFVGQRCFCDAVGAQLVPVSDSVAIVVDVTKRSIWKYDTSQSKFVVMAKDFTMDATSSWLQVGARNSTTITALGTVPSGISFMWFNWCTNKFETQIPLTSQSLVPEVLTSMSSDGIPYVLYYFERNPTASYRPDKYVSLFSYRGDVPLAGHAECVPCPSISTSAKCSSCPSGYVPTVFGTCSTCGIGPSYTNIAGNPVCACPPGYFAKVQDTTCLPCIGKGVSFTFGCTECYYCRSQYIANDNHTACILCPPGTIYTGLRESADNICALCEEGTYTSQSAMTVCDKCGVGTYADTKGSSSCKSCPSGTSTNGKVGSTSLTACVPCLEGTFNANGGGDCSPCPAGTFGSIRGANSCTPCPAGTANPELGQTSCRNCTLLSSSQGNAHCPSSFAYSALFFKLSVQVCIMMIIPVLF